MDLLYLWNENHLIGIGLSRWLYCDYCEKTFKLGLNGIDEQKLEKIE
jgi:hypothetical protein